MTLAVYLANLQLVYLGLMVICALGVIASMFTKEGKNAIDGMHINLPDGMVKLLCVIIIIIISPVLPIIYLITKFKACFKR